MPYIAATCPHCSGDLKINSEEEKGYCVHCGSQIDFSVAIKTIKLNGPIELQGYMSLGPLLKTIDDDLKNGNNNTDEFKQMLYKALELDPDNKFLYDMITSQIWMATIENGELISYSGTAEKVVIPEGVTKIAKMAFDRCHQLREVSLPKSIELIQENAFLFESKLIINAYKGTYGARYAIASPAKFNLLDIEINSERQMHELTNILNELETFRKINVENIEKKLDKKYSINWVFASALLIIPFMFAYATFRFSFMFAGAVLVSIIFALLLLGYIVFKTGYDEIKRKMAVDIQTKLFYKKSNDILGPLGINDFKYYRSIFTEDNVDLDFEISRLQKARDKVISMDFSDVYEKPYIYYPVLDFLRGEKPSGYKKD